MHPALASLWRIQRRIEERADESVVKLLEAIFGGYCTMPFLADLDEPPRSRLPGLLWGLAAGVPILVAVVGWLIPMLVGTIMGGAQDLDSRLRTQDRYMTGVCETAYVAERDQSLCECVGMVEFPALDCQGPFRVWAVAQQTPMCETSPSESIAFCSCINQLAANIGKAESVADQHRAAEPWDRCSELGGAFALPDASTLRPADAQLEFTLP